MIITFGMMGLFFAFIIFILQRAHVSDKSFADYAVGGRSFGAGYQMMSFLNTWYPGAVFTAFAGLAASVGVISFYMLAYSLLTVVLMYLMAHTVWIWGKKFDLNTQPDLFALRYNSRHIRAITAVIGIVSGLPWLVLAMQAMGGLFHFMSFGALSFSASVLLGVLVLAVRQFWTVRMGMRGVIISDMYQGIVAYVFGGLMLCGLIAWLVVSKGVTLQTLPPAMFDLPGPGSKEGPLYLFCLLFTGAIGGWCWPAIFVRLFTADGVDSLKKSAALSMPFSVFFGVALLVFGMLASQLPLVKGHAEDVWFIASQDAGGLFLLGCAGVVLLAASMGATDGVIQATGAQIANDLVGNYTTLNHRQLILVSKVGMVVLTGISAWLACQSLPKLFTLAVLAYQGVIQLAVPQFLGIFWKRGNKAGAIAGMIVGFSITVIIEIFFGQDLSWAYGATSGAVALLANLAVYVGCAFFLPESVKEKERVDKLFAMVRNDANDAPQPAMADPIRT